MPRNRTYRVRVWFGRRTVADHRLTETEAAAFARAIHEQWPYLTVTCELSRPSGQLAA